MRTTILVLILAAAVYGQTLLREETPTHMSFVVKIGTCTGFVAAKGLILTAGHCVQSKLGLVSVVFSNGRIALFFSPKKPIRPSQFLTGGDVAVLVGDTGDAKPAKLHPRPTETVGKRCLFSNHGGARDHQYSSPCVVSRFEPGLVVLSAVVVGGDSGAPAILEDGRVVGMILGTGAPFPEGYALRSDLLIEALKGGGR
jgi:hypothetical protein